jgi:Ca-activated chloride channel family protein
MKKLSFLSLGAIAICCVLAFTTQHTASKLPMAGGDSSFNFSWEIDNVQFDANQKYVYLYTELNGGKPLDNPERKPLNIALVIDRSGSMQGAKLQYALQAAKMLVQNLHVGDHFALVDYDDQISTPVFSTTIADNRAAILAQIDKLTARGSTNLCGGMLEGYNQAKTHFNPDHVNRVILFSDGLANTGISSNDEIKKIAKKKLEETGISISSFGIGSDYNEQLMTHLAEYGNGNYYFINNADEIPTHLATEMKGLMQVVAQNISLRIKLPENNLEVEKVYGAAWKVENGELIINAGSVVAEETKTLMVKFKIKNLGAQALNFTAHMTYLDARSGSERTYSSPFATAFNQNKEEVLASRNTHVWNVVQNYDLNDIMEMATLKMEQGQHDDAKKLLDTIYSSTYSGFVNDTINVSNTTVVKTYQWQIQNATTYHSKSDYEKKVILKQARSDNYKMRSKGKK